MTTAQTIINRAAEITGYKDPGETLSSDDAQQFLAVLNALVDSWNTSRLYIVATSVVNASVSSSPVSIGSGQTLNVARPIRIEGGFVRSGGLDYPIKDWLTASEYDSIASKSDTSPTPWAAYYQPAVPNGSLYLWPAPSGAIDLHVRVMTQLSEFAGLSTEYDLAPGYKRALQYSLAEELHPNRITPQIARLAASSRRAIKRANHEPLMLDSSDVALPAPFDIRIGQ